MLCDLNVIWNSNSEKTILALQDLGYSCVALNVILTGKIPANYKSPIQLDGLRKKFPTITILSRVTICLDDVTQNQNFQPLYRQFDIIAVRPITEKTLQSACTSLDIDLISLDMTKRQSFFLRHKTVGAGLDRGVKFEIAYSPAPGSPEARKHVISNAASVIRAARNRGILISSEASEPGVCRGPYDVVNLACVWGLNHMRAREAVGKIPQLVTKAGYLRNHSYKQVIVLKNVDDAEEVDSGEQQLPLNKKRKM